MTSLILTNIILGISVTAILYFLVFMYRNHFVYRLRRDMLQMVSLAAKEDIDDDHSFEWRYDALMSVGYDEMVNKFWKPIKAEAFYEDLSFLYPNVKKKQITNVH